MKTRIIHLQFAFFLKDIVSRPDHEFGNLNSNLMNIFDGMPQILPIPVFTFLAKLFDPVMDTFCGNT